MLLANADFARAASPASAKSSQRDIRVLVKDNYSYGGIDKVHPEMESRGGCLHRLHREDGAIGQPRARST
jgi:hypothetical protein